MVLEGAATQPAWAIVAGLRALGFDGGLIEQLATVLMVDAKDATGIDLHRFAAGAVSAHQGVLTQVDTEDLVRGRRDDELPLLWVRSSDIPRYDSALNWLLAQGVFDEKEVWHGRHKLPGKTGENEGH
jgi:hypothetical protein